MQGNDSIARLLCSLLYLNEEEGESIVTAIRVYSEAIATQVAADSQTGLIADTASSVSSWFSGLAGALPPPGANLNYGAETPQTYQINQNGTVGAGGGKKEEKITEIVL